jgi:hypothetical protein
VELGWWRRGGIVWLFDDFMIRARALKGARMCNAGEGEGALSFGVVDFVEVGSRGGVLRVFM